MNVMHGTAAVVPPPGEAGRGHIVFERVTSDFTLRLVRYPAHFTMAPHAHGTAGISVVLDGALAEEVDAATAAPVPGWTVVKPAGTFHANRFGPHGATILAVEPRSAIEAPVPTRWHWTDSAVVCRAVLRCLRIAREPGTHEEHEDIWVELVASLAADRPAVTDRPWLRKVKDVLDDARTPPPSVAALAAGAGVHPVYLARRFRGAFGLSLRAYRQVVQVRRAAQLIVRSHDSLSAIAQRCGFADHSHMCRSFRVVARTNPAALRDS